MPNAQQLLATAQEWVDRHYVEGPRNNETPFGAWAGSNFQPWCCAFTSWCLDRVGAGIGKIVYCPSAVAYYRSKGQLHTIPQVGDQGFSWFPSKGRYAHTWFVKSVDGDWVVTLEGNSNTAGSRTGGMCVSLRRKWRGTKVVFGRPVLDQATPTPTPTHDQPWPGNPSGKYGGYNQVEFKGKVDNNVRYIQSRLHLVEDGKFGPATEKAVREFQMRAGFRVRDIDGIVGPKTWAKINEKT